MDSTSQKQTTKGNIMNPDRIKEAVELADGWSYSERGTIIDPDWRHHSNDHQQSLDAIAAQLVRQVDEMSIDHFIEFSSFGGAKVTSDHKAGRWVIDKDRTENTINAILDSKVLK